MPGLEISGLDSVQTVASLREIEAFRWNLKWEDVERALDSFEAKLALARGRLTYTRFLLSTFSEVIGGAVDTFDSKPDVAPALPQFQRAAELFRRLRDVQGEAEALFWIGTYEQVVSKSEPGAFGALARAHELASGVGDKLIRSCAARHLAFHAVSMKKDDEARSFFEESVRLRRELGFPEGAAAALVALAEFEAGHDSRERARQLLGEAKALATASGAVEVLRLIRRTEEEIEPGRAPS